MRNRRRCRWLGLSEMGRPMPPRALQLPFCLLPCMSLFVARTGRSAMSDLSPLSGGKRNRMSGPTSMICRAKSIFQIGPGVGLVRPRFTEQTSEWPARCGLPFPSSILAQLQSAPQLPRDCAPTFLPLRLNTLRRKREPSCMIFDA
jgi:hypothetical protein